MAPPTGWTDYYSGALPRLPDLILRAKQSDDRISLCYRQRRSRRTVKAKSSVRSASSWAQPSRKLLRSSAVLTISKPGSYPAGHSHVVIEQIDSLTSTTVTDPTKFAFFKGLNDPAANGVLSATVTGGLPAGVYKVRPLQTGPLSSVGAELGG